MAAASARAIYKWGWTAGGGLEAALGSHWTFRAEALYVNLGDSTHSVTFSPNGNPTVLQTIQARFDNSFGVARVGLNYKFGGW